MPYIKVSTTTTVSEPKMEEVKSALGQAIAVIPGKSERYLMVEISDNHHLWLQGKNDQPLAFVEVNILGKSTRSAYEALTAEICKILQNILAIPGSGVYVKYSEIEHWGFNGSNF